MIDNMKDNTLVVDKDKIVEEVNNMKLYNYRFVSMTCEKEGENYEFIYHFDSSNTMKHIKASVALDDKLKSISGIYPAAFLIENEYQDLYGFKFEGLLVDYKGHLYMTPDGPQTPMVDKK